MEETEGGSAAVAAHATLSYLEVLFPALLEESMNQEVYLMMIIPYTQLIFI